MDRITVRFVRGVGVCLTLAIWVGAMATAFLTRIPQIYAAALLLFGFIPYLVVLHIIEPWLEKFRPPNSHN